MKNMSFGEKNKVDYIPQNDPVVSRSIQFLKNWNHRLLDVEPPLFDFADVILKTLKIQMF